MTDTAICSECGAVHSRADVELAFKLPDAIFALSAEERDARCIVGKEECTLDGQRYFLRGLIPIPVRGRERVYCIGAWAEIDAATRTRIRELWTDPLQSSEPPFAAILANSISLVPSTLGLPISLRLTGPTTRPEFLRKLPRLVDKS